MKKLLIILVTLVFTFATVNAQVAKPEYKKTNQHKNMACYDMKDGKMYKSVAGKETLLEKEVTLQNGEIIMPNGMCKMKDGKEITLKNGECIDAMGNFHKSHLNHHKKA